MFRLASFALLLFVAPLWAQTAIPTDEAYQRLQQRLTDRAAAATQPASLADQLAVSQAENARLRAIIVDLQLKLAAISSPTSAVPVATATPAPVTDGSPAAASPAAPRATKAQPNTTATTDRPNNGETQTGSTATGIATYTGPRGGQYHYSKSGNKVYEKRK